MTRISTKKTLASNGDFKRVDNTVALREVPLIEAVLDHKRASVPPSLPLTGHLARQSPRAA